MKVISPNGCGALKTCGPTKRSPGVSAGTTKQEIPFAPSEALVEAKTV